MPVAAADRDRRRVPGQPPGQRGGPAPVEPAPVPDLEQRRPAAHRAGPAVRPGERVVDRQQPARGLGRIQPGIRLQAEVDPADIAERSGVPAVGRHLLPGQQGDPVPPRRGGQFGVVADRVVIGDGQKVEPAPGREGGQLRHGQRAVRVHGVRVQVTGQPAVSRPGRKNPARRPVPGTGGAGRPGGGSRARRGRGLRRQPVAHAVRRDAVHADHHLPGAGLDLARQVAGRGRGAGDDKRLPGAAGPAAEPVRAKTAEVEYGSAAPVVVEFHPQPGRPGRHVHRQIVPGGREAVLERPPPGVPRGVRHANHLTTAIGPTVQRYLTGDIGTGDTGPGGASS